MSDFGKNNGYNLRNLLFREVSAIPLALFRICFGGVLFYEFGRLLWSPVGQVRYLDPIFHFKYPFFEWVTKGPEWFLYAVFVLGTVSSVLISLGLFYRIAVAIGLFCYAYLFLLDISFWNNHYYLYTIFLFLLLIVNGANAISIDNLRGKSSGAVPVWYIGIFQFQIIVLYVYGAVSKLVNPDWMSNSSVSTILGNSIARNELDLSDQLLEFLVFTQTYGGIGFDMVIGFVLIYRRTFVLGVIASLAFHLTNHFFLNIGSFPFAMIGTLFLFIPQKWLGNKQVGLPLSSLKRAKTSALAMAFLFLYAAFQILFPLRHFTYDGLVFWTGEGKLGAWHMMSGSTSIDATYFYLYETEPATGDTLEIHPVETANFLTTKQQRTLGKWPFLIPQFANFLKTEGELAGMQNVKVSADVFVSRNGHRYKPIVPYDKDLATLPRKRFGHNPWILLYAEEHF